MANELCVDMTVESTAALLLAEHDWLILTHQYPDGDTLGSAFALCRALQLTGRSARVVCNDEIPEKYEYLTTAATEDPFIPTHICAVDVADVKLLGAELEETYGNRIDLCIDHHISNTHYAHHLLLKDYSATAMIVLEVVRAMGVQPDELIAEALYTGISTDTGCFKYSNTTALTHRMAAELMEVGIRSDMINRQMFDIKSRARIELERMALADMRFYCDGRVAVMPVTLAMINKANARENDMEGLSPLPRQIEGVWIGVMLREKVTGGYKVSFRSGNHANASAVALQLGGGGHVAAAGCTLDTESLEAATEQVLTAIRRAVPGIESVER